MLNFKGLTCILSYFSAVCLDSQVLCSGICVLFLLHGGHFVNRFLGADDVKIHKKLLKTFL